MMSGKKQNLKNEITVIVGPTSSGKTSLALELCKKIGGVMISADSRQIYSEMDIGTGKIPVNYSGEFVKENFGSWTFDGIKVYGYDLAKPNEYFSVYDYASKMLEVMADKMSENLPIVIVGGTGFYIDVLTGRRILDSASPDLDLRQTLEKQSTSDLLNKLQQLNPNAYAKIDKTNTHRVLRAVEKELTVSKNTELSLLDNTTYKLFGLTAPREYLYNRADTWAEQVWKNGLLEETSMLLQKYPDSLKLQGIVYRTAIEFLRKNISEDEAIQRLKWDLHSYIRRQFTWFNKNPSIEWLNISEVSQKDCILKLQKI